MHPGKRRSRYRRNPANKLWLAGLVLASVALMVLSRGDVVVSRFIVNNASDLTAPILEGLSEPIGQLRTAVSSAGSYAYLVDEVARLRQENDRLRALKGKIEELGDKVRRYEEFLNTTVAPQPNFVTARVVGDAGSPFVRTVLINAGRNKGVGKDQPVVDSRGLVGRTMSTGRNAARVLLLTDLNSRVPIRVQPAGYRAVLAGNNTDRPKLEFLPIGARPEPGNRIVTSGHGGLFPPGLPVGVVEAGPDGKMAVKLAAPVTYLEYVRVLDRAPEVIPEEEDTETPVAEAETGEEGEDGQTAAADEPATQAGQAAQGGTAAPTRAARQPRAAARTASSAPGVAQPGTVETEALPPPPPAVLGQPGNQERGFGR